MTRHNSATSTYRRPAARLERGRTRMLRAGLKPCIHRAFKGAGHAEMAGFTLIELMVVVAIIAILAAIAYPSYTKYTTRTHRAAAEACLSNYANYMERYYSTNMRYDQSSDGTNTKNTLPNFDCASNNQTGESYTYGFDGAPTRNTYTLKATPKGSQASRDKKCAVLTIDQTGTRTISGSGTVGECW